MRKESNCMHCTATQYVNRPRMSDNLADIGDKLTCCVHILCMLTSVAMETKDMRRIWCTNDIIEQNTVAIYHCNLRSMHHGFTVKRVLIVHYSYVPILKA
eukprot:170652_1